jgi:hypothetical protein
MIAVCVRSILFAATVFFIGVLLGLSLHLVADAVSYSSRNASVVVSRPMTDPVALAAVSSR